MLDNQPNPFASEGVAKDEPAIHKPVDKWRLLTALPLITAGLVIGLIGLALVSNQYGNTDIYGLPVVALGGVALATGISRLMMKLRYSLVVGILAAPASVILLFVLYWIGIMLVAASNA